MSAFDPSGHRPLTLNWGRVQLIASAHKLVSYCRGLYREPGNERRGLIDA
jgi:hypothetical protein